MKTHPLFDTNPFDYSTFNRELFLKSFRENALHHYERCSFIQKFWQSAGVHPSEMRTEEDLTKAPPVMVHLFKEHRFQSVPDHELVLTLTSSGTGGTKSIQLLNEISLANVKRLAFQIHKFLGMTTDEKCNYLCFTYDPKVANDLGTAFTDELLTSFTGINEVYYAFQWSKSKNDFEFNEDETAKKLIEFSKQNIPVRILGFPAFLHRIIEKHQLKLSLPKGSWIQTGGGWKTLANQEIPKPKFREHLSLHLGVPLTHIRDLYGMVEHGVPYVDCEKGNLHIPNYSRVFIRNPHDLSFLPAGEVGLMQFICTYNESYPAFNILVTDYGSIGHCDCSISGPTLQLHGRAGVNQHKGCAIKALDLIKNKPEEAHVHLR